MGMENIDIMALTKETNICRKNEYWFLEGVGNLPLSRIEEYFRTHKIKKVNNKDWVLNKCIEIRVYSEGLHFQGFEFKICISYLKKGINICYDFLQMFNKDITGLDIYILNKKIKAENSFELYDIINTMYEDKINMFKKQYGNVEIKTTSGNFYSKIRHYNKLYYKLFAKIKYRFFGE